LHSPPCQKETLEKKKRVSKKEIRDDTVREAEYL